MDIVIGLQERSLKYYVNVMLLSHGKSSTERNFSIDKEILDNNLQEKSLISQSLI